MNGMGQSHCFMQLVIITPQGPHNTEQELKKWENMDIKYHINL